MRRKALQAGVIIAALAVSLALAVAPAGAHKKKFLDQQTVLSFSDTAGPGGFFSGRVLTRDICEPRRFVTILRITGGQEEPIATVKTIAGGSFIVAVAPVPNNQYQAFVSNKRVKRTEEHKHTCIGVRSAVLGASDDGI